VRLDEPPQRRQRFSRLPARRRCHGGSRVDPRHRVVHRAAPRGLPRRDGAGPVREARYGARAGFARHATDVVEHEFLSALVVLGVVAFALAIPDVLVGFFLVYLFFSTPYLVVLEDRPLMGRRPKLPARERVWRIHLLLHPLPAGRGVGLARRHTVIQDERRSCGRRRAPDRAALRGVQRGDDALSRGPDWRRNEQKAPTHWDLDAAAAQPLGSAASESNMPVDM